MYQSNLLETHATAKGEQYQLLIEQLGSVFENESDFVANMANCAAILFQILPDLNWAGFYILRQGVLVLGPFQGKPACVRIQMGKGVCGTAAQRHETVRVENVNEFPGHIACDIASQSEIVLPIVKDGRLIGVLDVDSPSLSRFDAQDAAGLEGIVARFIELTDIPVIP